MVSNVIVEFLGLNPQLINFQAFMRSLSSVLWVGVQACLWSLTLWELAILLVTEKVESFNLCYWRITSLWRCKDGQSPTSAFYRCENRGGARGKDWVKVIELINRGAGDEAQSCLISVHQDSSTHKSFLDGSWM